MKTEYKKLQSGSFTKRIARNNKLHCLTDIKVRPPDGKSAIYYYNCFTGYYCPQQYLCNLLIINQST